MLQTLKNVPIVYYQHSAALKQLKQKEDPTMTKFAMDMVLEYPKVFEENRDMGGDQNNAAKKAARHNGQYVVNAYFTSEDQIQELLDGGMDPKPMGNDRVKEGGNFGIGKFVKLTRMHDHKMTFTDKNGKETEVDFGGAPKVVNLTNGLENKAWWSFEADGAIGNGSRATVQFETYSNGAGVRLCAIGVTDLVAYEASAGVGAGDDIFNMDEVA